MASEATRLTPRLILGVSVIFIGLILTLDSLDVIGRGDLFRFWPFILVVIGLLKVLQPSDSPGRESAFLWLGAGVVLLFFAILDALRVQVPVLKPLALTLIGVVIVWRAVRPRRRTAAASHSAISAFALMGGVGRSSDSQEFAGGDLTAIMGGCEIDLRHASIVNGEAVIETFVIMGGIEIKVPEDWSVETRGVPLMGSYEDTTKRPRDSGKRLIVTGLAVMGGVEITN